LTTFGALFVPTPIRDAVADAAWLEAMLRVEAALARAEARAGVLEDDDSDLVADACHPDRYDVGDLCEQGRAAGNPVEPLVRAIKQSAPRAHFGATSQDILDSAAMLVARNAVGLIDEELDGAVQACARLAEEHRGTKMAARTLLQQAVPTTFGLKAAGWLVGVVEARNRLAQVELAAQLGGAAGTLASLGDKGVEVMRLFAEEVGLAEPPLPWHANRVRVAELAAALELAAGACGKIAVDVTLLAQSEVGEVSAPAGVSTAMAHKRNPATAVVAVAAARQVAPRIDLLGELERAAGAWQAEWATITAALGYAGGAAAATRETLEGLQVDAARMRANIHAVVAAEPEASDVFVDRALEWYGR
jgi:3-carboxy-cis,cis-muconate cycloisomerase